jgi:hypothetical protein
MAAFGEWIMKSGRIAAWLGGVGGFFCGAYIMATCPACTDGLDTLQFVVVVLISAIIISSFCIAICWLAGLVLGVFASPFSPFAERLAKKRMENRHESRN